MCRSALLVKILSCPNCSNRITVGIDFKHEMICNMCGRKMK